MTELAYLPALELARLLRQKQIGAEELLQHQLQRTARLNPHINALPVLDAEPALQRARAADKALASGQLWGPLHGLPMTVKESFNLAGLPTTFGFEAFAQNIASEDAVAVQRLKAAGAIVFGKSNVPTALADWQSFNPVYGTTRNPWDLARTPGGSSGGSAAALAAGLSALELGTDIGASIRNPAHYCGVYGHKPTWGVVPLTGQELTPRAFADDFDLAVAGPLARSAFDLSLALDLLTAPLSVPAPIGLGAPVGRLPAQWQTRGTPPRRCRVALLLDDDEAPVDAAVQQALLRLHAFLQDAGTPVVLDARPVNSAEANDVYVHLLRASTGSLYDDNAYADAVQHAARYAKDDRSHAARHFRGNTFSHRDWVQMNQRRRQLQQQWAAFFEAHDLLICPVATTPAFAHNQQGQRWDRLIPVQRPDGSTLQQPSTDQLFWAGYPTTVGLPACAVPLGLSAQGLPVGAQIIGPWLGDHDVLRFAQWLETDFHAFVPPPLKFADAPSDA